MEEEVQEIASGMKDPDSNAYQVWGVRLAVTYKKWVIHDLLSREVQKLVERRLKGDDKIRIIL